MGVRKAQSCIHHSYLGAARALIYSRGGELGVRIVRTIAETFGQVIALFSGLGSTDHCLVLPEVLDLARTIPRV